MKKIRFTLLATLSILSIAIFFGFSNQPLITKDGKDKSKTSFLEGDIVFQTSSSRQSSAIQLATNSKYSHCGILLKNREGKLMVAEAVQPVRITPIKEFIKRGDDHHYVIKRLINRESILTNEVTTKMEELFYSLEGRDYDIKFEWSDSKIYCSELVWKIYERTTGIRLGEPKPLKEYSLNSKLVKKTMEQRYGEDIPWDEPMVAPSTIFDSELLETVIEK
ncbi:MAG: peptidoglycan peptidase [Fluviicola sp.]|nr:MAG: peptidoglycan peptidase [Fluviicola sp.]